MIAKKQPAFHRWHCQSEPFRSGPLFRIGHGFDLHRLEPGLPFTLGGIKLDHDRGSVGHSDGDVIFHSVVDAILGALGMPDIGQLFSDKDPQWKGASSSVFMQGVNEILKDQRYFITNLDITLILERPKVAPYKDAICQNISELLNVSRQLVNVKAKTHEKVDSLGQNMSVACYCVVLLQRQSNDGAVTGEDKKSLEQNITIAPLTEDFLEKLYQRVVDRSKADPQSSWTSKLFSMGKGSIGKKVGEEATETIIAGMENNKEELIKESADLLYHLCVYWAYCQVHPKEVYDELGRREHQSGLSEKASRSS
eukprot:jgi/Galph1/1726/GphlegSOOS_G410.1